MTLDEFNQLVAANALSPSQIDFYSKNLSVPGGTGVGDPNAVYGQTNSQPTTTTGPTQPSQPTTNTDPTKDPFINSLYNGLLGRNVENSSGSASYLPMNQNFGSQAVANSIMQSPEFASTKVNPAVSSLYQSLLGRGTDSTGMNSWTANTQQNGIQNTIQGLENSPEAQVKNDYLTYLGRDPTSSDLSSGMSLLGSGGASNQGLIDQLKSSPAYQAIPSMQRSINQQSGSENAWKGQQQANLVGNQYDAANSQALQQAMLAQQQSGLNQLRAQGPKPGMGPFVSGSGTTGPAQISAPSGGGGSSLICTELLRQKRLDRRTQVKLAKHMLQYNDSFWRGYWLFAGPVSWLMKRSPAVSKAMEVWFTSMADNGVKGKIARGSIIGLSAFFSVFAKENVHPEYEEMLVNGKRILKGV